MGGHKDLMSAYLLLNWVPPTHAQIKFLEIINIKLCEISFFQRNQIMFTNVNFTYPFNTPERLRYNVTENYNTVSINSPLEVLRTFLEIISSPLSTVKCWVRIILRSLPLPLPKHLHFFLEVIVYSPVLFSSLCPTSVDFTQIGKCILNTIGSQYRFVGWKREEGKKKGGRKEEK